VTLQAGAPSTVLFRSLEDAGWGDLAGAELRGVRAVLGALVRALPPGSAAGVATAEQVASTAGYSEKWTRRCLHFLEDLELIDWRRGGVVDGRPQPSHFRIDKTLLLALVHTARRIRTEALAELRARTTARLNGLKMRYVKSKRWQTRRSVHAEPGCSPSPNGEGPRAPARPVPHPTPPDDGPPAPPDHVRVALARAREAVRMAKYGR
jgi:hypothetical protein